MISLKNVNDDPIDLVPQAEESSFPLNTEELKLISLIRSGDYERITIKQRDGRIELIEKTRPVDPDTRIVDLLKGGSFQNITIKQREGKVVHIRRTEQEKS